MNLVTRPKEYLPIVDKEGYPLDYDINSFVEQKIWGQVNIVAMVVVVCLTYFMITDSNNKKEIELAKIQNKAETKKEIFNARKFFGLE